MTILEILIVIVIIIGIIIFMSKRKKKTEHIHNWVFMYKYKDGLAEARSIAIGIITRICDAEGIDEKPYIKELYNGN